jgi:site-specific recombinase XerD
MIDDMRLRNFAPRTIDVYVGRVASFARHFGRSPEALGRDEVRAYLLHLVHDQHVCWSTFNQTVAGLRFLYEVTLGREEVLVHVACPKQPKKLPVVLSPEEVARFFAAIVGIKTPSSGESSPSTGGSGSCGTPARSDAGSVPAPRPSGSCTPSRPSAGRSRC